MALTGIGTARTPGRPLEVVLGPDTTEPDSNQEVLLMGHVASGSSSGTVAAYTAKIINNSGDVTAALTESEGYFGVASELSKMVVAAIKANEGGSVFPRLKCVNIPFSVADYGPADEALEAAKRVKAEFLVSPYDATETTLRGDLKSAAEAMSAASRVSNNQFGTVGVMANMDEDDPSALPTADTEFLTLITLRDTSSGGDANPYSVAELAAAAAARMASNLAPFNPLDDLDIPNVTAPVNDADNYSIGDSLESEVVLGQGWSPLKVLPNGDVAFTRAITARLSADGTGSPVLNSYIDVQDFQVLYLWRKTLYTRFSQRDFKRVKASEKKAQAALAEMLRLAASFEDQEMFQAVDKLAPFFRVQRSSADRSALEYYTPVNVVPGLHRMLGRVEAVTTFDSIVI